MQGARVVLSVVTLLERGFTGMFTGSCIGCPVRWFSKKAHHQINLLPLFLVLVVMDDGQTVAGKLSVLVSDHGITLTQYVSMCKV